MWLMKVSNDAIEMLERITSSSYPVSLMDFSNNEIKLIQSLIYNNLLNVTIDWKVWPPGKPIPNMEVKS